VTFGLGVRHGTTTLSAPAAAGLGSSLEAVELYHAWSSHGRSSVVARAPSLDWGEVPPFLEREGPATSLPEPFRSAPRETQPRGAAAVATLLHAGAGITDRRGGLALRAAASSGALFPTELYLVARSDRFVSPGIYHYAPERHALVRPGEVPSELAALGVAASDATADGYVVATSVFRRSGRKYRDRAYRYAVADAGHALANVVAAARELGIEARFVRDFAEARMAASLGVDEAEQGVLAVLGLGEPASSTPRGALDVVRFEAAPLPDASSSPLGATGFAHRATSLRWSEPSESLVPLVPGGSESFALPPPSPAELGLLEAIAGRRSERSFAARALPLAKLSAVLEGAAAPAPSLSGSLHAFVLAARVEGLPAGSYAYAANRRELSPRRAGAVVADAGAAALGQDVIARAPVVVAARDRPRGAASRRPAGYRHALLEAGIVGGRIYLEAERRGLGACTVGAFLDEEIAEVAGLDPERWWVVQLSALGERAD
jgi:SagB-type dehydrogenase family enzyme